MKLNSLLYLICVIIFVSSSCSKDSDEPEQKTLTIEDINGISIELKEVKTTAAWINVRYDTPNNFRGFVKLGARYRLNTESESAFQETTTGWIEGLEQGKKYVVVGYVEVEGQRKETETIVFTTPAFYAEGLVGTITSYPQRQYRIWEFGSGAEIETAPEISGYLKVGTDSLALENIEVDSNSSLTVTLPNNTQYFFKADEEYILKKDFSIGLLSGEFYTEITESEIGTAIGYWVQETPHFMLYNKIPYIDGFTVLSNLLPCEEGTMVRLNIKGGFGAIKESFFYPNTEMEYEDIALTISKTVNGEREILSYFDSADRRPSGGGPCSFQQFVPVEDLGANFRSMQHPVSTLLLKLDRDIYENGVYQVQFTGIDQDGNEWVSNTFDFTIDL